MGKIITVHGTFAQAQIPSGNDVSAAAYWWRPDSPFIQELRRLVAAENGEVEFEAFEWSGNNSETERRKAGLALLSRLQKLEDQGQSYSIIAHSHGGTVVSSALLKAAHRKLRLPGLKRWITVGTPFVELRRERYLFLRLPILMKALFVASLMLFLMFALTAIGALFAGNFDASQPRVALWLGIGTLLTALPFAAFLIFAYVLDHRQLYNHRPRVRRRAAEYFADRWVGLTHEDDEAVRGLGSLGTVRWNIFQKSFAVPALSLLSVFILPAGYLYAVTSPKLMVDLTDLLKQRIYETQRYRDVAEAYRQKREQISEMRGKLRDLNRTADDPTASHSRQVTSRNQMRSVLQELETARDSLQRDFKELPRIQRASRFSRRFLERDGKLCHPEGRLCDEGRNISLNSRLVFHLVTDEASSWFIDPEVRRGVVGRFAQFVIPILMVPLVFGAAAIVIVLIVQGIARLFSSASSNWLDDLTWKEVTRAALGNDTESEVALGTLTYPSWIGAQRPFLPAELGNEITATSNDATLRSLGKFRNAISDLALLDTRDSATNTVLAYLTWNELIHTTYFAVPGFQRLVAHTIGDSPGFALTNEAGSHPDADRAVAWHDVLRPAPGQQTRLALTDAPVSATS